MLWRLGVLSVYPALAVWVGLAAGGRGLVILGFFYLVVIAWAVFLIVLGRLVRRAGRGYVDRLDRPVRGQVEPPPDGEPVPADAPAPVPAAATRSPAPAL